MPALLAQIDRKVMPMFLNITEWLVMNHPFSYAPNGSHSLNQKSNVSDLLAQRIGKSNNMLNNEQFQKKRGIIPNYYEWTVQKKGCVYYSPFLIVCIDLWKQKQQDSTILHFASGLLHFSLLVSKNKHLFGVFLPTIRRH